MGKKYFISFLLLFTLVGTCAVTTYAGNLQIKNVEVKGNYVITDGSAEITLDNVSVDGCVSIENGLDDNNPNVKLNVSESSTIGGVVTDKTCDITNNGRITGFVKDADGIRLFTQDGIMAVGFTEVNGNLCYFKENGIMAIGFTEINGDQFYFDENGAMAVGLSVIKGNHYYFNDNGIMAVGFSEINGDRYYFDENGVMAVGLTVVDGNQYYFKENGIMAVNETIDGYNADENGVLSPANSVIIEANEAVQNILSRIIKPGMTEREKFKAIYDHMNSSYNWRAVPADVSGGYTDEKIAELALYLIRNGKGNCDHLACLEVLLIRGIGYQAEPIVGQRRPTTSSAFYANTWVVVYIDGVRYHFDPGFAFLLTDEQVSATHRW